MASGKRGNKLIFWIVLILGVVFVVAMNYLFTRSEAVREIFSGNPDSVIGEVSSGEGTLAAKRDLAGRISMLIFAIITVLQFLAFVIAYMVVGAIRQSAESVQLKLARLESSEIFFDVPLYVGLFGTISAFLVMTFSPQSSRLIAYSSTLVGIIFSLLLRITLQYPLRQKLESEKAAVENTK